jgi:hypothetical protein
MQPGTYAFRMNLAVGTTQRVNIPIDVVVQPLKPRKTKLPILFEAKSAGDFTNTNKRRKEEATKVHQLRAAYGSSIQFMLFVCGYFGRRMSSSRAAVLGLILVPGVSFEGAVAKSRSASACRSACRSPGSLSQLVFAQMPTPRLAA